MADNRKLFLCEEIASTGQLKRLTTDELVDRLRRNDRLAQTECFRRWFKRIYNLARKRFARKKSVEDAEEITSATLFTVMKYVARFSGRAKFETWMYAHVKRRAIDHYAHPGKFYWIPRPPGTAKQIKRSTYPAKVDVHNVSGLSVMSYDRLFVRPGDLNDPLGWANDAVGDARDRLEELCDQFDLDISFFDIPKEPESPGSIKILSILSNLGRDYEQVICYRKLQEKTLEETGGLMKRSPGAVSKLCNRAVDKLAEELKKDSYFRRFLCRLLMEPSRRRFRQRLVEPSVSNIQRATNNPEIRREDTLDKNSLDYQEFEQQDVPYFDTVTFETFFHSHDTQGETDGEFVERFKRLSHAEKKRRVDAMFVTMDISRVKIHRGLFKKSGRWLRRRYKEAAWDDGGDIFMRVAVSDNRVKDLSEWVNVNEYMKRYKRWEGTRLDSVPDDLLPPQFKLRSSLPQPIDDDRAKPKKTMEKSKKISSQRRISQKRSA